MKRGQATPVLQRRERREGDSTHQLAEVVNGVAEEGRDCEIVGTGNQLVGRQLAEVDAGQVEQSVLVVRPVLGVNLEVVGRDAVEAGPDRGLDAVELGQELVALLDRLLRALQVAQQQLAVREGRERQCVGLGRRWWRRRRRLGRLGVGWRVRMRQSRVKGREERKGGSGVCEWRARSALSSAVRAGQQRDGPSI
jgi:hypothetical protein